MSSSDRARNLHTALFHPSEQDEGDLALIEAALQEERDEVQKGRQRLIDTLKFYSDTRGLHPFIKVFQSDPLLNPDGPPDAYGLSDELCIPAREALAAMEAENG